MYLRYREQSWETDAQPSSHRVSDGSRLSARRPDRFGIRVGNPMPSIELRGVKLHAITELQAIAHILDELDNKHGGVVVTPNLDHLRRYVADVNFRAMIAEADLVVADGMPLVWASKLQRTPLPERVAGSNLISSLSGSAAGRGRSVYLLGGSGDTAKLASDELMRRYPTLRVAGWYSPPMGFERDSHQMATIIASLSAAKPDIVYVALGSPKQEQLIARLLPILPDAWWLGVGNSFSFLCGDVKRAPLWMQHGGLEWVHRLYQEPRRLFKRYITSGIPFGLSLMARSTGKGLVNTIAPKLRRAKPMMLPSPEVPIPVPLAPARSPLGLSPALEAQITRAWPLSANDESERTDDAPPVGRLRAMVLLGGSVRANALSAATGRSVLDLPLDEDGSILNFWLAQAAETAKIANIDRLPVRVMVNQNSPEPRSADARYAGAYRVERDLSEYRGTGGLLRDISSGYADDDLILVVNAAQILLDPLSRVVSTLIRKAGDVAVISHEDGTPSGIMLVSCKTLRMIPERGFIDMKEQALPLIASKFEVRVVNLRRPTGLPVRSLEGYVQALHYYHRRRSGKPAVTDLLAEDWTPSFSLVEPGATVDASARIHDSVVLAGASVEPGAVLVRSVVCPGTIIRRDRTAVDQLITIDRGSRKVKRAVGSRQ
jgi:N-acetylglucosaminyldiphosphoundecaprenol N-acetyl-beta-D-mannosaminyltransferase